MQRNQTCDIAASCGAKEEDEEEETTHETS